MSRFSGVWMLAVLAAGCAHRPAQTTGLTDEVKATERAFAGTMAARDIDRFAAFVSPEAVFFDGDEVLRGREKVLEAWTPLFTRPEAPFSWEPARVEVLDSGRLALSTGPVRNAKGTQVATFTSIWRREGDGRWQIIFDKGCQECPPPKP